MANQQNIEKKKYLLQIKLTNTNPFCHTPQTTSPPPQNKRKQLNNQKTILGGLVAGQWVANNNPHHPHRIEIPSTFHPQETFPKHKKNDWVFIGKRAKKTLTRGKERRPKP
ncbi:MAG: hypothetical protein IPO26_07240 [Saprospiraceae bacterium]|nr:hypothetical protein [Saprospiraceae bacterium]